MNTYRFTSAARGGMGRVRLSMLGGVLVVLLSLLLPSVVFAAAARVASPSLSPTGVLEQAGVSVVRLAITYTTRQKTAVTCTALGTLIASWPAASATEQNNWVVTDASLLSPQGGTCSKGSSLSQIQILANHLYTNTPTGSTSSLTLLDTLQCRNGACQDQSGSTPIPETLSKTPVGGGVLFSFHTTGVDMQPYLDPGMSNPSTGAGIELAAQNGAVQWPVVPQITEGNAQAFLTPINPSTAPASASGSTPGSTPVPAASPTKFEPGMPFVDAQGHFIGMQVSGTNAALFTVANLQTLEQQALVVQQAHGVNILKQQWEAGIQAFDLGNYVLAQQKLEVITQEPSKVNNPNFQAAKFFEQQAAAKARSGSGTPTAAGAGGQNNAGGSSTFLGIPTGVILVVGLVAGVIFLVLLLVLVSLVFGRRRALRKSNREELERFKADEAAARRSAPLEARRIAEESQRNNHSPAQQLNRVPSQPLPQASPPASTVPAAPPPAPVPQAQPQPQPWLPEQAQPDYEASSDAMDAPTVPIIARNGQNDGDVLAEGGHVVRELRNVSLAVGSVTNVGLKRQHKPNEDSFFAFQAAKSHNAQPMQFGLFIIADGMGGHANGQDASRTAIQTMIDFMLPKISVADGGTDDQSYLKLLEEGVQHANYAVHQRNLQDRADMGTTMTTALVIGSMAYIANVGDSRTYLYRQSTGLTKVTRDHSVVASLVDAGIIQPDDIYTHPKRNQIYRSLGEKPVVEVDSFSVELQPGDKLLLCTDGLWDMVRDPEIQRIIAAPEPDPTRTGEELIQAALKGGGDDNVSVIVVSISEAAGHTGMTGIQFLSKPETVTVPDLPAM